MRLSSRAEPRPRPRALALACALACALALLAALPGCGSTGRMLDALTEGFGGGGDDAPLGGIEGQEREAWLGPLAALTHDADLAELALAFEEVPSGQSRRWKNFDTQAQWEVTPHNPANGPKERRLLLVSVTPETGAPAAWVLAADRDEDAGWLPAPTDAGDREALLGAK